MQLSNEEGCIRYLMKEMDPSEELEFEKRMREDEDLLIEVESLRATYRKLDKLPEKSPPPELLDDIREQAREVHSQRDPGIRFFMERYGTYAAAAVLLLVAFSGGYFIANLAGPQSSEMLQSNTSSINPWVDQNEVLRYQEPTQSASAVNYNAEMDQSFEKLKLVESPGTGGAGGSGILLTGSPD